MRTLTREMLLWLGLVETARLSVALGVAQAADAWLDGAEGAAELPKPELAPALEPAAEPAIESAAPDVRATVGVAPFDDPPITVEAAEPEAAEAPAADHPTEEPAGEPAAEQDDGGDGRVGWIGETLVAMRVVQARYGEVTRATLEAELRIGRDAMKWRLRQLQQLGMVTASGGALSRRYHPAGEQAAGSGSSDAPATEGPTDAGAGDPAGMEADAAIAEAALPKASPPLPEEASIRASMDEVVDYLAERGIEVAGGPLVWRIDGRSLTAAEVVAKANTFRDLDGQALFRRGR